MCEYDSLKAHAQQFAGLGAIRHQVISIKIMNTSRVGYEDNYTIRPYQ